MLILMDISIHIVQKRLHHCSTLEDVFTVILSQLNGLLFVTDYQEGFVWRTDDSELKAFGITEGPN